MGKNFELLFTTLSQSFRCSRRHICDAEPSIGRIHGQIVTFSVNLRKRHSTHQKQNGRMLDETSHPRCQIWKHNQDSQEKVSGGRHQGFSASGG